MFTAHPYLNFPGTTEEAFRFYQSVFGGEFLTLIRFKDTTEVTNVPENEQHKLMHIALPLGKGGVILMGTDVLDSMCHSLVPGNQISLTLTPDSQAEAQRLFEGLSVGGKVSVPLEPSSWGTIFGMLTDAYGIQWMIDYTPES